MIITCLAKGSLNRTFENEPIGIFLFENYSFVKRIKYEGLARTIEMVSIVAR